MATILMAGGANAEIASKKYVDDREAAINVNVEKKADKTTVYTKEETNTAISDAVQEVIAGDFTTALQDYVKTDKYNTEVGVVTELAEGLTKKVVPAINEVNAAAKAAKAAADGKLDAGALDGYLTTEAAKGAYAVKGTETVANTASTNAGQALQKIGNLETLETTAQDDLVSAINEVKGIADGALTEGNLTELRNQVSTNATNIQANKTAIDAITTGENSLASKVAKNTADIATANGEIAKKANSDDVYDKGTADTTFVKSANMGILTDLAASAPRECATEGKTCALTFDGTTFVWEVIAK